MVLHWNNVKSDVLAYQNALQLTMDLRLAIAQYLIVDIHALPPDGLLQITKDTAWIEVAY